MLHQAKRRSSARARPSAASQLINKLPDELLVHCLEFLPDEERMKDVALVGKRFHHASVAATPACRALAFRSDEVERLRSAKSYLEKHAQHVRTLELESYIQPTETGHDEAAELISACAAACAAAAAAGEGPFSLRQLSIYTKGPPLPMDWLPSLPNLQHLELGTRGQLRLPAGMSHLHALKDVRLRGCPIVFEGARLAPGITSVRFTDSRCANLPPQITELPTLAELELAVMPLAPCALAPLAGTSALRRLSLAQPLAGVPASLRKLTALRELSFRPKDADCNAESDALGAALPPGLTSLHLGYRELPTRLPPALAMLPRLKELYIRGELPEGRPAADMPLPTGYWMASLRTLEAPWSVLGASVEVLQRGAPRLNSLACKGMLTAGSHVPHDRLSLFFDLLSSHSALRFFNIDDLRHCLGHRVIRLYMSLLRQRPDLRIYQPR